MKKHIVALLLFCAISPIMLVGQAPDAFKYQALARDGSGNILPNQSVSFRIGILKGSVTGTIVYSERHYISTNAFGLVNLDIGGGTPVTGTFGEIEWSIDKHFIKVEMDPAGGESFVLMGISQLLSVPYALHARTVEIDKINDDDADPTNEIQTLEITGNDLSLTKGGGTVTLPSNGDRWGDQVVQTDATLAGNGTILAPLVMAQQSAAAGQVLKWNGTTWKPANDSLGTGFALPYSGAASAAADAFKVANTGAGTGIRGEGTSGGVIGTATVLGVMGSAASATGETFGVKGLSSSTAGYGVYGKSPFTGVYGEASATSGINYGIHGKTPSANGYSGYFEGGSFFISGNTGIGKDPLAGSGRLQIAGGDSPAISALSDGTGNAVNVNQLGIGDALGLNAVTGTALKAQSTGPVTYTALFTNAGTGPAVGALANDNIALYGTNNSSTKATLNLWNKGSGPAAEFRSNIKITDGSEGLNKVLTSDAQGLASWQVPPSGPWLVNGAAVYYNTGRVGIGTNAPSQLLSLFAGSSYPYMNLGNNETGQTAMDGLLIGIGSSKSAAIVNLEDASMKFGTHNTLRMTITNNGLVGIGQESPSAQLQIDSDTGINKPHLLLNETQNDYARLMFKNTTAALKNWTIAGLTSTTDGDSRLNFYYDNGIVAGSDILSITGTGEVQHRKTGTEHILPIAYGHVRSDGHIFSGTGNFSCAWNSTLKHYELTITGEDLMGLGYTTVATPAVTDPNLVNAFIFENKLVIRIFNLSGTPVQCDFQFVTYKQ